MSASAGNHRQGGEPDLNALAAWADGRLGADARNEVTAHLAGCPRCRAIVAELARGAAPAARAWTPRLAIAATLAVAAIGAGAYLIVQPREQSGAIAPATSRPAPAPRVSTPSVSPAPPAPTLSSPSLPSSPAPPSDRRRAAGTTSVHGKTFHLVAGEWIDDAYRESDFLPAVDVASREQLDRTAALRPFAGLGSRFTVVVAGTVYRVSIP
jgi:Putative zinc-finger